MASTPKPLRCKDRQCRKEIALIGGSHKSIVCPHCNKEQRVYTDQKGFRVIIKNQAAR
jgi:hypothetical protein